jgi:hypothetical protein
MLDLIRQAARLAQKGEVSDPEEWFQNLHGSAPTYSRVLEVVARTTADRSNLLRQYFDPSEAEREAGAKRPTKAHRAIARMVRAGYFKVLLTTNFDRLLETAFSDEDVRPQVVHNTATIRGMTPLQHSDCTIVKVHGDYLDLMTRNTAGELSEYDAELDALLDRVLTEYGLVVCGWSGEWDVALCESVLRATRHRFATYWMSRSQLGERAAELVGFRNAHILKIESADEGFEDLEQKLLALEERRVASPVSTAMAVSLTKRHITDKIRLDDLVRGETKNVVDGLASDFGVGEPTPEWPEVRQRMKRAEVLTARLQGVFSTGCRWGTDEHHRLWRESLEALMRFRSRPGTVYEIWQHVRFYPACLVFYAGGMGALSAESYGTLRVLLEDCQSVVDGKASLASRQAAASSVLRRDWANPALELERRKTPMSDHVNETLRPLMSDLVATADKHDDLFDTFEFMVAMAAADYERGHEGWSWIPLGRFVWKRETGVPGVPLRSEEISEEWPPLRGGLFGGDTDRARTAHRRVMELWGSSGLAW